MKRPLSKRKCQHCQTFFDPDPRSARRQRYCSQPACRHASKATSQRRWLHKPANRDYFTGPTQVERVRQWRKAHPGYWRRHTARPADALQDALTPQPFATQTRYERLAGQCVTRCLLYPTCCCCWAYRPFNRTDVTR